jgi:hypothetical protein
MGKWFGKPREAEGRRFKALPGSELADLRNEAHRAFDVHWEFYPGNRRERFAARTRAYQWLARQLGIPVDECHFGMFGKDECRRAIEACRAKSPF